MSSIAAVVLAAASGERFAGIELTERAILSAARAGISRVHVVGASIGAATEQGLRERGVDVTSVPAATYPLATAPHCDLLLVLSASTIVEPAAIRQLIGKRSLATGEATLAVDEGTNAGPRAVRTVEGRVSAVVIDGNCASLNLAVLSRGALESVRQAATWLQAIHCLARNGRLGAATVAPSLAVRLTNGIDRPTLERHYLQQTNGGSREGIFTRSIRAFSVPLSRRLVRLPVTANHVTLAGFALSVAAGLAFAAGTYRAGLLAAVLYFASMILDCCDGEVARAKFADSKFGAWLETVTDYLSYFVVLAGIVWGDVTTEGFCKHAVAAAIGGAGTLALVLMVGYLRARIAAANPGAFDDALAADLERGTIVQRFAKWGRQFIKRSFLAHLILFQALIGEIPALTEMWALGTIAGVFSVLLIRARLIREVRVEPLQPALDLVFTEN